MAKSRSSGAYSIAGQLRQMKINGQFPNGFPGDNYRTEQKQALEGIADNWAIPDDLKNAKFVINEDFDRPRLLMQLPGSRVVGSGGSIAIPDNATAREMQGLKVYLAQRYKRKQER